MFTKKKFDKFHVRIDAAGKKDREYGGRRFSSKREAIWARAFDFSRLGHALDPSIQKKFEAVALGRRVVNIEYQPRFLLLPKPNKIEYVADFIITWDDGSASLIDVKGMETDVFKLKKKMFQHFYPDRKLSLIR